VVQQRRPKPGRDVIGGVRLVDIEPLEVRVPVGATAPRMTEYRLSFADGRERFVAPRGGRVRLGLVNPGPKAAEGLGAAPARQEEGDRGRDDAEPEMIRECLRAMGLPLTSAPRRLEAIDPPRDVKWFGNHAPTELAKLLEFCGCVFVANTKGNFTIEGGRRLGADDAGGRVATDGDRPPTAGGPDDRLHQLPDPRHGLASWSARARPRTTRGRLRIRDPRHQRHLAEHLPDPGPPAPRAGVPRPARLRRPEGRDRERVKKELYRFVRIPQSVCPPDVAPVLMKMFQKDGTAASIEVSAFVAVKDPASGLWRKSNDYVKLSASYLYKEDVCVLQFADRAGTVSGDTDNPDRDFKLSCRTAT
jgi:hypothetical protein